MQLSVWPQSLFGRLIAASALAVLLAHATGLLLIAQEREHFVLQGSVREWSRRIAEITFTLQPRRTCGNSCSNWRAMDFDSASACFRLTLGRSLATTS